MYIIPILDKHITGQKSLQYLFLWPNQALHSLQKTRLYPKS